VLRAKLVSLHLPRRLLAEYKTRFIADYKRHYGSLEAGKDKAQSSTSPAYRRIVTTERKSVRERTDASGMAASKRRMGVEYWRHGNYEGPIP
jgi:hypothetical protein